VLNREMPFLRICLPLCLGIITGIYYHPGIPACIGLIAIASALFVISLLLKRRMTNPLFGLAFYLSIYVAGLILFTQERTSLTDLKQAPTVFSGVITDFPEEKANTLMITIRLNKDLSEGTSMRIVGSIIIYCKKDTIPISLIPGDSVIVKCTPADIINRGNPFEFDYRFYMQSQKIKYYSFAVPSDFISITHPAHRHIRYRSLIIRNKIIDMFRERGMSGKRLALASAITLGEKSHLDPDQKQYFINAGIMHIMAVSGLHAVILSYFIFGILFFLRGRLSILRIIITLIFLWAFAFVTGLTPSVVRATLMFSFLQTGKLLKRPVNSINSVLASAVVLILFRPSVIFDAGFLLSYSAVIYIILFYQDLSLKVNFSRRIPEMIWQSAAVTITAQAGTLPLTIMLFNRFPTWFILTNVIIVPVSSLLIMIGCLVPMTFPLALISGYLTRILDGLTWLTEFLTEKAASLPLSTIDNIGITTSECILLTLAISLLLWSLLKKPRISLIFPLLAFTLFSVSVSSKYLITGMSNELIVYNTSGAPAIGIRTGRILRLYTDSEVVPKEVARHCSVLGLKIEITRLSTEPLLAVIGTHKIIIAGRYDDDLMMPTGTDFLILTSANPIPLKKDNIYFPEGSVIITIHNSSGVNYGCTGSTVKEPEIWQVKKSGAYSCRL
jgi:competence protein ComEC